MIVSGVIKLACYSSVANVPSEFILMPVFNHTRTGLSDSRPRRYIATELLRTVAYSGGGSDSATALPPGLTVNIGIMFAYERLWFVHDYGAL